MRVTVPATIVGDRLWLDMDVDGQIGQTELRSPGAAVRARTTSLREPAIRTAVVVCVLIACGVGVMKLDDALGVFDLRADLNSSLSYQERTHSIAPRIAGSRKVMEDGRLWMPEDATYRVVFGSHHARMGFSGWARYYLNGLLLPRRQTESPSARWVFCYGCEASTLGRGFEVLSDDGRGLQFGRLRS
ncbi:MAG: hypothetical protein ACRDNY_00385 [Gaiellaceae bacterium]